MTPSTRLPIIGNAPAAPPTPYLPTVAALDELWRVVSAKRLYAPPNFVRYLKLRWRMRLKLVDPEQVRVVAPHGKINDCHHCTDICCLGRHSTVLLRLRDIAALIDIGRADLISLEKPQFTNATRAARPALQRQLDSRAWTVFPVLKQNSMAACAALTLDGRCGLYPHWPLSCARFPYALHGNTEEVFYSQRCDSFWIRPDGAPAASDMVRASIAAYNERIKDAILLAYAPTRLHALGVAAFLNLEN